MHFGRMSRFQVGDTVRVVGGPLAGEVTEVVGPCVSNITVRLRDRTVLGKGNAYPLAIPAINPTPFGDGMIWALEEWLEPLTDSRERGEWDELTLRLCNIEKVRL